MTQAPFTWHMILGVRGMLCATRMRAHTHTHTHTESDDCKSMVRLLFLQPMSLILVELLRTLAFQVLGILEGQTLMGKKRRPRKPKDLEGGVPEWTF